MVWIFHKGWYVYLLPCARLSASDLSPLQIFRFPLLCLDRFVVGSTVILAAETEVVYSWELVVDLLVGLVSCYVEALIQRSEGGH